MTLRVIGHGAFNNTRPAQYIFEVLATGGFDPIPSTTPAHALRTKCGFLCESRRSYLVSAIRANSDARAIFAKLRVSRYVYWPLVADIGAIE